MSVNINDIIISGGLVAETVLKKALKNALGIEGTATLNSVAFSSDNVIIIFEAPVDDKAKFAVSPSCAAGNSFFNCVKVK